MRFVSTRGRRFRRGLRGRLQGLHRTEASIYPKLFQTLANASGRSDLSYLNFASSSSVFSLPISNPRS